MQDKEIKIFYSKDWQDYELLDTGEGEKLERFGKYTFVRPYEDAVWPKALTEEAQKTWANADGKFWSSKTGAKAGWKFKNNKISGETAEKWEMEYKGIKFLASPTPFRHLGFFPEQATHWDFIEDKICARTVVAQEEKRGNKYHAIIMDPPKFGRGPKGETWKLEEMLPKLLTKVRSLLSDEPLFIILTSYATDASSF